MSFCIRSNSSSFVTDETIAIEMTCTGIVAICKLISITLISSLCTMVWAPTTLYVGTLWELYVGVHFTIGISSIQSWASTTLHVSCLQLSLLWGAQRKVFPFSSTRGVTVGHCSVPAELLFEWEGLWGVHGGVEAVHLWCANWSCLSPCHWPCE